MTGFVLHSQLAADSLHVRDLGLSQLRLQDNAALPWLVLVPRRADVSEIHQLGERDRAMLIEEIAQASRAIEARIKPDKINVAALGNVVPQLHVHVVGRFKHDPVWPGPIWGRLEPQPYAPEEAERLKRLLADDRFWR